MKEPWVDDPTWLMYKQAIARVGGPGTQRGRLLVQEADKYLQKRYFMQETMDLGAMPISVGNGTQQGVMF